ncbi:MAG: ferritin family protein, partial [Thiobacillus sp.]
SNGLAFGDTASNLASAIASENHDSAEMYPAMARVARDEGFHEIADWFETLATAELAHARRFQRALNDLGA